MAKKSGYSRRSFLAGAAGASGGLFMGDRSHASSRAALPHGWSHAFEPGATAPPYGPRERPKAGERVHEFEMELTVGVHEIVPGVKIHAFTYNNTYPGPQIRVPEGDWVLMRFSQPHGRVSHHSLARGHPAL